MRVLAALLLFLQSVLPAVSSNFNGDVDYTLDAKDRLTQEVGMRCGGYTETNVWDGASNPTTFRSNSGRTYNGSNQRSNTGYAYDGNGNPTTYASTTCTYDVENRLTAFGSEEYSYRADGLRASVGSGSSKVYYLYDQGKAVCQLDYQGNLLRTYVYAPDGMVGRTGSSQTRYYLFDWQGNVEHSMSSSTNLNVSYAFNAWGQRNQKFPVNADVGANDQFGYNARWGYMRENTTGFYYCQNRYYDPANGRWLTRDPIGFAGGMNVYGYCGGGPVGVADPEGEGWRRTLGGIAGGVLGGLLSGGNPAAILAGIGIGGGMGDAAEQAEQSGEINWGNAALAGGADAAGAYLGGKLLAPVGRYLGPRIAGLLGRGGSDLVGSSCSSLGRLVGRRGGALHRAAVQAAEDDFKAAGYTHIAGGSLPERLVRAARRAPDLIMRHAEEGELYIQVGRVGKRGLPVAREVNAAGDLAGATGIPVIFIPYNVP